MRGGRVGERTFVNTWSSWCLRGEFHHKGAKDINYRKKKGFAHETRYVEGIADKTRNRVQSGGYSGLIRYPLGSMRIDTIRITPPLLALISEIDEFKGAWRAPGTLAPARLNAARRIATIESIGSSTRVEGSRLTDSDVESLLARVDIKAFAGRDDQDVAGYADVAETVFEAWANIPINENHIRQLHGDLLVYREKDERHRGEYN